MPGSSIRLFFKNNPAAQWAAGIAAGIVAFLTWLALHDSRVRREARAKAERKAEKQADKIIKDMKEKADERVEDALEARERVPDGVDADGLRDDAYAVIFGRKRDS